MGYIPYLPPIPNNGGGGGSPYVPPIGGGNGSPYNLPPITNNTPIGGGNGSPYILTPIPINPNNPPYNLPTIPNNPTLSSSNQSGDLTYRQLLDAYNATRAQGEKTYTPNSNQTDNALTAGIKDFGAWVIFLVFVLVFLYIIATGETPLNTLIKMGKNGTLIPVPV